MDFQIDFSPEAWKDQPNLANSLSWNDNISRKLQLKVGFWKAIYVGWKIIVVPGKPFVPYFSSNSCWF